LRVRDDKDAESSTEPEQVRLLSPISREYKLTLSPNGQIAEAYRRQGIVVAGGKGKKKGGEDDGDFW